MSTVCSSTRKAIWERDRWICCYCGIKTSRKVHPNSSSRATVEHILPRKYGGTNDRSNLKTACNSCNNKRDVMPTSEWLYSAYVQARRRQNQPERFINFLEPA